uniref:Thioredoxin-like protein CITRXic n=1 Tax=Rhizophora mucronata TaxID=61149 RepID=A0A2P2KK73_RHIMU
MASLFGSGLMKYNVGKPRTCMSRANSCSSSVSTLTIFKLSSYSTASCRSYHFMKDP